MQLRELDVSKEVVEEAPEAEEEEGTGRGGKVRMNPEKKSEGKITFERLKKEATEKRKDTGGPKPRNSKVQPNKRQF